MITHRDTYNTNSQIKFKTSTLNSSLSSYSNAYILVSGNRTVVGAGSDDAAIATDRNNKPTIIKNFAPLSDSISETNNAQVDNAEDLNDVILMYNLIEHSDNYSKTSRSLYQFCRFEPNNVITESESFKFKSKFLDNTKYAGIIYAKISVPLKCLSSFWRILEMPTINCEINLIVTWSANFVISKGDRVTNFAIKYTKVYVLILTLSTEDNTKLLQQLKSRFKRTISSNHLEIMQNQQGTQGIFFWKYK